MEVFFLFRMNNDNNYHYSLCLYLYLLQCVSFEIFKFALSLF
jgi:hypothetical protein